MLTGSIPEIKELGHGVNPPHLSPRLKEE